VGETNPLHYEHNGLKSVGISRGDLMAKVESLNIAVESVRNHIESVLPEGSSEEIMRPFDDMASTND
jgi:hypothetical protein